MYSPCRNRKIPDYPINRGSAGCDLRRLGIAIEIAHLPPVLVIDDPSLKLDVTISVTIFECLQKLAKRGHIVLVSMKKPQLQEFKMIDSVVLLAGGFSVFSCSRRHIESYFCDPVVGYVTPHHRIIT